jgi:YVTN family beta-propeller protein
MKPCMYRLLAIAAFASCCLAGAQSRAQNAYITNSGSNSVSVIATATNTVVDVPGSCSPAICVGTAPFGVAVTPDGSRVYVANADSKSVSVIATATNTVVDVPGSCSPAICVGSFPVGVAVTPDGSKVYVANDGSNSVSVIATATNTTGSPISVGEDPVAFGVFIQPPAKFAGTPGFSNCHGVSVSALARQYGGLNAAAAALGFPSVAALQNAIMAFCEA